MDQYEAMRSRHSVRQYLEKPLPQEAVAALQAGIDRCNRAGGLHIQLVTGEPSAFDGFMAHYGKFSGVTNYIALVGPKGPGLDEACGYYGEQLVLEAQAMGLNTCWVALTYRKTPGAFRVEAGEKLALVIALGYGKTQGVAHKSKAFAQVAEESGDMPGWYRAGVEAALLAPTAMNQQKFRFSRSGSRVSVKAGAGFYAKVDLGIVKYHFELAAGRENFSWAD